MKESFLVFDFTNVNLINCLFNQDERKSNIRFFFNFFFTLKQLGIVMVINVYNQTRTIYLAEYWRWKISHIFESVLAFFKQ